MKKGFVLLLLFVFTLSYFAPKSEAVSCAFGSMIEPWMEWDNRADAVIVATVTDVKHDGQVGTEIEMTADVLESYKGIEVNQITFTEKGSWGDIKQVGETYILGLMLENNKWVLPLCSWIASSMTNYNETYQQLSAYPKLEISDSPLFKSSSLSEPSSLYFIALAIVIVAIAVLVTIYFFKPKPKRH